MFSWLSITPFGWPVVPDEYTKNARSFFESILVLRYLFVPAIFRIAEKCLNLLVSSLESPIRIILSSCIPA